MQAGAAGTRRTNGDRPRVSPRAPKSPSFAVVRHRLVRRLEQATALRVTQIVAPAGYGKSVLLAQWAVRARTPVVWLNGGNDNNAAQLARSIVSSLNEIE